MIIHIYQDKLPQLKHRKELGAQEILKVFSLDLCHVAGREIQHLFRQKLQDVHAIFTDVLVSYARSYDLRDEDRPVLWPFSSQKKNQGYVQFLQ